MPIPKRKKSYEQIAAEGKDAGKVLLGALIGWFIVLPVVGWGLLFLLTAFM